MEKSWIEKIIDFLYNPGLFLQVLYFAFGGAFVTFCFKKYESFLTAFKSLFGSMAFGVIFGYIIGKGNQIAGCAIAAVIAIWAQMVWKKGGDKVSDTIVDKIDNLIK